VSKDLVVTPCARRLLDSYRRIAQLEAAVEAGKRLAATTKARDVHPNINLAREQFYVALEELEGE
jgi:hypothetical protein